jgi:ring-1,2-phenylacetyl-CoA epoxidase subunit PaaD
MEEWNEERVWNLLEEVSDPEIPVVNIVGMGILRGVQLSDSSPPKITVAITPTYSGCPAMDFIEKEIVTLLKDRGFPDVCVDLVRSPAWTTDWMTEETKRSLKEYGIAPPSKTSEAPIKIGKREPVECPYCDSLNTELRSQFGSTSCKAMHYCSGCHQPFEEFKPF